MSPSVPTERSSWNPERSSWNPERSSWNAGSRTHLRRALLTLVLGGFLFVISPASAGAGAISGIVTNSEGAGLEGICVSVDGPADDGIALTDFLGRYTVGPLYTGKYTVRFNDCGKHNVAIEWYDNAASYGKAKPVNVKYGKTTSGIDAKLALNGDVFVKGPEQARRGKKTVYRVTYKDTYDNSPYKVRLEVKGKGVRHKQMIGKIKPGASKTVKVKLKFRESGRIKVRFKVRSVTGGGVKTVNKWVKVRG